MGRIQTDTDFGSQIEDMDAINVYMRSKVIVNNAAYAIKDDFIRWWDNLSWYDKQWGGPAFDEARTRRNKFNLANVKNESERKAVEQVITTGMTAEEMQGKKRPMTFATGEVGTQTVKPSTTGTMAPTTAIPATIRQGSKGDAVKQWQGLIGVAADGNFGPQTAAATKAWQKTHNLTADGVVGPMTWAAALPKQETPFRRPDEPETPARPMLTVGSKGAAVTEWQTIVGVRPATGFFGESTKEATIRFQKSKGLSATGVVDARTWELGLKTGAFAPGPTPSPSPFVKPQAQAQATKPATKPTTPDKPSLKARGKEAVDRTRVATAGMMDFSKWPGWAQATAVASVVGGVAYGIFGKKFR